MFRQPELAHTLKFLSQEGRDGFYNSPLTKKLIAECPVFDAEDFKAQKSEWVSTLSANYRGIDIHEIPPNGQGLVVLETMKILEGFDLSRMSLLEYEHTILEALKLSFADGHRYIADPHFENTHWQKLLSEQFIRERRGLINDKLWMTFGCMGGNMQPQGQVQILSNLIDRNMKLQEALCAARVRVLRAVLKKAVNEVEEEV